MIVEKGGKNMMPTTREDAHEFAIWWQAVT